MNMGTFVCAISERDWTVARKKGIYGNKTGKIGDGVKYTLFSPNVQASIIRDLVSIKPGDNIFFHIVGVDGPSRVHGIYCARSTPFYDKSRIWENAKELFPYRFLFEPHPKYPHLGEKDAFIKVVDFYELIEQRKIWTLATLENEMNIEARSVRRIDATSETDEVLRLLYRDARINKSYSQFLFTRVSRPQSAKDLRQCIVEIGRYENSIKALIMHNFSYPDREFHKVFGEVTEFMNEVFIAQTTRKSIDILWFNNNRDGTRTFTVCEVKTDRCDSGNLSQLLYYMDLFKRKSVFNLAKDGIVGCLVGKRFSEDVVQYAKKRNAHGVNGSLHLIRYVPNRQGTDAKFERVV